MDKEDQGAMNRDEGAYQLSHIYDNSVLIPTQDQTKHKQHTISLKKSSEVTGRNRHK